MMNRGDIRKNCRTCEDRAILERKKDPFLNWAWYILIDVVAQFLWNVNFPCSASIVFVVSQHNRVNITSIDGNNIYRTHGLNVTEREKEAKRNFN